MGEAYHSFSFQTVALSSQPKRSAVEGPAVRQAASSTLSRPDLLLSSINDNIARTSRLTHH
jgi:hypothetical protein